MKLATLNDGSRDGHLVLHHDAQLGRTSDGRGPVSARTLAELRRLDWTSWKGVRIPPAPGAGPAEERAKALTRGELALLLEPRAVRLDLLDHLRQRSFGGLFEAHLTVALAGKPVSSFRDACDRLSACRSRTE